MDGANYCLIAVIAVLLLGVIKGYRRGFLRIAVSLVSLVFVVILATKISPYVGDFIVERTPVYENVRHRIIEVYAEKNNALDNSLSENQDITIESYELPDLIASALISNNTSDMYNLLAATLFEEYISGYLAKIVIKAGSFCGLFAAFAIVIFMILTAIKILEHIPVLKTFNRILGMFAGLSVSLIIIWVFFTAVMIFFTDSAGMWMLEQIKRSILLSYLFNNNLLLQFIL